MIIAIVFLYVKHVYNYKNHSKNSRFILLLLTITGNLMILCEKENPKEIFSLGYFLLLAIEVSYMAFKVTLIPT